MISLTHPDFWDAHQRLPVAIKQLARKNYRLWQDNPKHPSLRFKQIREEPDPLWSVRVGLAYRAVGTFLDAETFVWLWIGKHDEYERFY